LCWSPAELGELRGTTLELASGALRKRLQASWDEAGPLLR